MLRTRFPVLFVMTILVVLAGVVALAPKHLPVTITPTEIRVSERSTAVPALAAAPKLIATAPPTNTRAPSATPAPADTLGPPPTNTHAPTMAFTEAATDTPSPNPTTAAPPTDTPSSSPTAAAAPTNTITATPMPDAVTLRGYNLLNGPGGGYLDVILIGPNVPASITERTDDRTWVKIRYFPAKGAQAREGWIETNTLQLNISLDNVPVISGKDLVAIPTTNLCTAVVGDSIANGGAIFEIPKTGYVRAPMGPMSLYITQSFRAAGVQEKDMKVYDRSVGATGISSPNHPSYFDTPQYASAKHDHCKFTVIMPWINDLSPNIPDPATNAPNHAAMLVALVQRLLGITHYGRILVVNYYVGKPTEFALKSFAPGFTPEIISAFNQQIAAICGGALAAFSQVTCVNINSAFAGMDPASYVVGPMTRDQINAQLVSGINAQELTMYNQWADGNPKGQMLGDGVHLSRAGKQTLAAYLVNVMRSLPDLKPYYQPTNTPTTPPLALPATSAATTGAATTPTPSPTGVG